MAETLSEQVARLERLRDVLVGWKCSAKEVLDDWDKVWEAAGKPGPLGSSKALNTLRAVAAAESRLADAERRGRIKGFVDGAGWMGFHYESDKRLAAAEADRRYPALPPEREGARERTDGKPWDKTLRCEVCGYTEGQHATYCRPTPPVGSAGHPTIGTTPPVEGSRYNCPLRVHGPFCHVECEEAQKLAETAPHLAPRLQVPDDSPTPPQAAPEPQDERALEAFDVEVKSYVGGGVGYLPITPELCQRIVETARRASGREGQ